MGCYVLLGFVLFWLSALCLAGDNLFGKPGYGYLVEVLVGTPAQPFDVLVDTGSTNFAIAGVPDENIDRYFHKNRSSTYKSLDEEVSVAYTQGSWSGELAREVVDFPKLNSVPSVECDVAFITSASNFYMNGSNVHGILGLAYPAIAKPSPDVKPWIDFLQKKNKDKTIAFSLKLCGSKKAGENEHYGSFQVLNNMIHPYEGILNAFVVREWFYEIILTGLFVNNIPVPVDCENLNKVKTIVDSGTTNLRLPSDVFEELAKSLMFSTSNAFELSEYSSSLQHDNISEIVKKSDSTYEKLSKDFWLNQKKACWSTLQSFERLPTISIEIAKTSDSYFRINLPAASYIRLDFDNHNKDYCYKFSVEPSASETIIGVIALEGFEVIFNRTARTVGFLESDCGPNVTLEGPFFYHDPEYQDLIDRCLHEKIVHISLLNIAAYIVCIALFFASCMFVYFFYHWLKNKYFKYHSGGNIVSMSHASLINEES